MFISIKRSDVKRAAFGVMRFSKKHCSGLARKNAFEELCTIFGRMPASAVRFFLPKE